MTDVLVGIYLTFILFYFLVCKSILLQFVFGVMVFSPANRVQFPLVTFIKNRVHVQYKGLNRLGYYFTPLIGFKQDQLPLFFFLLLFFLLKLYFVFALRVQIVVVVVGVVVVVIGVKIALVVVIGGCTRFSITNFFFFHFFSFVLNFFINFFILALYFS